MAADRSEGILTVPAELTRRCRGLAIDMGGSMIKFVYRTKEDFDQVVSDDAKLGQLRLVSFPRDEIKDGLDYIRRRAYLRHPDGGSDNPLTIYTTGVGCTEYGKLINETLNIRLENLTEFDCFAKALHYLVTRLPRNILLEPFMADMIVEPIEFVTSRLEVMLQSQSQASQQESDSNIMDALGSKIDQSSGRHAADGVQPPSPAPISESEEDTFPCMLAMCGSGFAFIKIEKDGTVKVTDGSNRGGRSFVGVGMLLTGCKSFDELIDLASKGNARNVDQYTHDLLKASSDAEGEDNVYTKAKKAKPGLVYCFGKAANGQDEFSREDKAAAWLQYILLDFIQSFMYACTINKVKRAFFSGGFTSHPLIRQVITRELARRNLFKSLFSQTEQVNTPLVFDFVKPGPHLGALGCLINNLNPSVDK